jgi:hypothetical protein
LRQTVEFVAPRRASIDIHFDMVSNEILGNVVGIIGALAQAIAASFHNPL